MSFSDHFWKLRCRESTHHYGREIYLEIKIYQIHHYWTTFGYSELVSRGRHKGLCTLSKMSKT